MNKFNNLMAECEYLKVARGYGILDALTFILDYEEEYLLLGLCRDCAQKQ